MRTKTYSLFFHGLIIAMLFSFSFSIAQERESTAKAKAPKPRYALVPDATTAVKIAEAVLIPVYGEQKVLSERPFTAHLDGDVWTISGTLHCSDGKGGLTTHCVGGAAEVKLSKIDGRILNLIHYK